MGLTEIFPTALKESNSIAKERARKNVKASHHIKSVYKILAVFKMLVCSNAIIILYRNLLNVLKVRPGNIALGLVSIPDSRMATILR